MAIQRVINPSKCRDVGPLSEEDLALDKERVAFVLRRKFRGLAGRKRLGLLWILIDPIVISLIYYFVLTIVKSGPDARSLIIGVSMYSIFRASFQSGVASVNDFTGGLKGERIRSRVLTRSTLWYGVIDNTIRASGISLILFFGLSVSLEGVVTFIVASEIMGFLMQGVGMNLTLVAKRIPDIKNIQFYTLRLLFFVGPVLYPMSATSGLHYRFNEFNPFSYFVELVRYKVGLDSVVLDFSTIPTIPIIVAIVILAYFGYTSIDRLRWEVSSWS